MNISVIIPTYNAARLLARGISSVLEQTEKVNDIIVVDDGSRDDTSQVVSRFGSVVTYITQQNGGPAKARNAGLRAARGEWIAFLDADDWWLPNKISLQVEAVRNSPKTSLVYTGLRIVDEDGNFKYESNTPAEELWPQLRWRNPIAPSCVLARRDALLEIGGFNENLWGCEDWEAWLLMRRKAPFLNVPDAVTCYRVAPTSLSSNPAHMFKDFAKMLDTSLLSDLSGYQRIVWRRRILSYQAYSAAMNTREHGAHAQGLQFLLKSLAQWPSPLWQPKRYVALALTLRQYLYAQGS